MSRWCGWCNDVMTMNMTMWWCDDVIMVWCCDAEMKWSWWMWWWYDDDVMLKCNVFTWGESLWMQHEVISYHPCSAQTEWHHGYIMWTTHHHHHHGKYVDWLFWEMSWEREEITWNIFPVWFHHTLLSSYIWDGMDINQSPHQWWE